MLHKSRAFAKPNPSLLSEMADGTRDFGPIKPDRPIVLYGAGDMGEMAGSYCNAIGLERVAVMDRERIYRRIGSQETIESLAPSAQVLVSIANHPYVQIERDLADLGFQHIAPFYDICESYRDIHPLSNGWFSEPLDSGDVSKIEVHFGQWADDTSRAHYLQFLAWRRLREEWTFDDAPVNTTNRYFIPEITSVLHDHEVFLDGGAYDGRVSAAFLSRFGGKMIAFEPDPASYRALRAKLPDRTIFGYALGDVPRGKYPFRGGLGYASQLYPPGPNLAQNMVADVVRLDDLDLSPTFVKLHLEGHELSALKGAERTLQRRRPIVAVTSYHSPDGLWRLPLWLMEHLADYRFLFRLHSWVGTGAVCYAIPNERH